MSILKSGLIPGIKNGNNIEDVKEMIELHFEYASSKYNTVKTISECIRTIY
ncbi:MAG: hypothetical protein HN704_18410 [Bacteroidetes bacterium]|jgi:hypothetical protein|nr:hypothetical protein [Bacteroidota bacterium]